MIKDSRIIVADSAPLDTYVKCFVSRCKISSYIKRLKEY